MNVLQSCGGLFGDGQNDALRQFPPKGTPGSQKDDVLLDMLINRRREAEALFGSDFDCRLCGTISHYDYALPDVLLLVLADGWSTLVAQTTKLAMRIDHISSQILCFAVAFLKALMAFAAEGVPHQMKVLAYAIANKNFLLPVQSFLSTQVCIIHHYA